MSKLSAKQNKIAQALMQKHGKDEIFVKIANGQMYFSKHSAQVGLSDTEFKEQFECVKRKAESKEPEKNPDNSQGGSEKDPKPDRLKELRGQYKEVIGKAAYNGWDAETLEAKIRVAKEDKEKSE